MDYIELINRFGNDFQKLEAFNLLANATITEQERKSYYEKILHSINIERRTNDSVKNFSKYFIENSYTPSEESYSKFLYSNSFCGLLFGLTQIGKSNASIQFILTCFEKGVPVIVSTDNQTDQLEQLYSRVSIKLAEENNSCVMKVSDNNFSSKLVENITNKNHKFVIFCLNNASQIEKLTKELWCTLGDTREYSQYFKKIAFLHDEGDQITKTKNVDICVPEDAVSHAKWLKLMDKFNHQLSQYQVKRLFVTATPENTVMLYNLKSVDVFSIEIPETYNGYKDIIYKEINKNKLNTEEIFKKEVNRIKTSETFEAILYCNERKLVNHNNILKLFSSYNLKCIIHTYNSKGMTIIFPTIQLLKKFEKIIIKKYKYKLDTENKKLITIDNISIRVFYSICKSLGQNCVITIGKDLIARGISYVSEDLQAPLVATTMIYIPGNTMHAVGICQAIGRITGCAMSCLKRTLYAPKDVIETYINYNKNQEIYIKKFKTENEALTKNVINSLEFNKINRQIDRKPLELKMKFNKEINSETQLDLDKISHLVNLWKNADTIIGKIFRFVAANRVGVSETELKEFIKTLSNNDTWYSCLTTYEKDYKLVFERTSNGITKIRKEALQYL